MKRYIFILVATLISTLIFANASFDKTTNYQFNNAKAYIGETLYILPLTGSSEVNVDGSEEDRYNFFMDYYKFKDNETSENCSAAHYKFNWHNDRDNRVYGTHKCHLEGHKFYVNDVRLINNYEYRWIFYLTDLTTGDKLKYIYHGDGYSNKPDFEKFPFIVEKYYNYCKSLIDSKLVFATQGYTTLLYEGVTYSSSYKTDVKTGEKINYTTPYVKWTIKNVGIDAKKSAVYFIVSNGVNTTKVIYTMPYDENNPNYNYGNRVFPEKQWNELVDKYGEDHMSLIMQTKMTKDMSTTEKYMAGGRRYGKYTDDSYTDVVKDLGKSTIKNVKSLGSDIIGLFGK